MRTSSRKAVQSWIHHVWRRCNLASSTAAPAMRDGVQLDNLEPRLCFSASPLGIDALGSMFAASTIEKVDPLRPEDVAAFQEDDATLERQVEATELVFIDGGVERHDALAAGLANQFGDRAQIYILDSLTDGIEQITEQLQSHSDISAIHILTHGSGGNVQLGDVTLNSQSLDGYSADLAKWAGSMSGDADILFYGCDLASSEDGRALVDSIAALTEADVAASLDKTGDEQLGGDWDLEYNAGTLQALGITQSDVGSWSQLLELTPSSEQLINSDATDHSIFATSQHTGNVDHFSESAAAVSSNGDHAIVWTSQGNNGDDVFVRLLDKDGNEIRSQQIVNDEFTAGNQRSASVAMDAAGNFAVVWVTDQDADSTSDNVYVRLYDSFGNARGSAFRAYGNAIATAGTQGRPDIAMNDAGMFAIVWDGAGFGENFGIAANIYDANGTSLSGVFDVNDAFGFSGVESSPTIGIDAAGTVSIAWNDDAVVSGASFAADGTPISNLTFPNIPLTDFEIRNPSIDVREDGMIAMAYEWRIDPPFSGWTDWNIDVQVLNPAFQDNSFHSLAVGPENEANDEGNASVSFNEDGSIFLTWYGEGTGDTNGVFARRLSFQSNGGTGWETTGEGPDLLVNQTTGGAQQFGSVASIDHDNFVVAWSGNGAGDADGVFARRFGTGSTNVLFLTSDGDVSGSATPGLDSWTNGTIFQFGGPDASYEPTGPPATTTSGSFAGLVNFDGIIDDGGADLDALHVVTRDIVIGTSTTIQLKTGDVLFSFKDNETIVGGLAIQDGDLALFRPDYLGDYTTGAIGLVLTGLDDPKFDNASDLRGISLVEQDTLFGDTLLVAGDLLYTRDGGQHDNDIYLLRIAEVGDGTTDGTVEKLIEGDDLGISEQIFGIDLIEEAGLLSDTLLPAGGLLLTINNTESFNTADANGANDFTAEEQDIVLLEVQQTTLIAGTAIGHVSLLFDADDVGLTDNNANLNGISLAGLLAAAPIVDSDALTINENSGDRTIDVLANDANIDGGAITFDASSTVGLVTLNGDNTFTYAANGQFETLADGDTTTDTFTYTVTTPHGSSTGTVTITVTGVNDEPTGGGYGSTHTENEVAFLNSLLTFANDVDDSDVLSVDAGSVTLLSGNAVGISITGNQISVNPSAYNFLGQGDFEEITYEYDIVDGNGGSTTVTAVVRINGINDAPTLSPTANFELDNVQQDDTDPTGDSVAELLASSGSTSLNDPDSPSLGIAVVAAGTSNGQWQFSTDSGDSWAFLSAFGLTSTVNDANAVLLNGDALIRFVPTAGFTGTADPLTFRGWDQSVGASGDISVNSTYSANSAFSNATNSVDLEVLPPALVAVDNSYSTDEDVTLSIDEGTHLIGWQARRQITIDNSTRSESFTDFPLLVRLDASTISYTLTQDSGEDLRFLDADGNQLDHEIESWNESGTSYVWVRIPQVVANSNSDSIWMYYGNSTVADGQAVDSVWGADYQAVYHFDETAFGVGDTLSDSVSGLDGINQGSSATTGIIGGAQGFDGNDYVDLGTNRPFLRNTSEATLSAWINADTVTGNGQIVGFLRGPGGHSARSRFEIAREGNEIAVYARTTDNTAGSQSVRTTTGVIQTGDWHQVVATVDFATDTVKIFVDGQEQATTGSVSFTNNSTPDSNSMQGTIGVEEDMSQNFFRGSIDEVRVSSTVRSADWVNAQYAAAKGSLISIGNEEATGGVLQNDSNLFDGTVKAVLETDVTHGTLDFRSDGSFTYTPDADFFGIDSFTYSITDGTSVDVATATILVDGVNDDPVADNDFAFAFQGVAKTINVLDNDTDIDNTIDPGTVTVTSASPGVTAVANADGSIDFTASVAGISSFTYTVTDAAGGISNQATVTVSVSDDVASSLWFSTFGDVDPSGVTGLGSWQNGDALEFGGASATYEPVGSTTDGIVSRAFGLAEFGADANVTALHYVSNNLILGSGADTFRVRAGDVFFAVDQDITLTSTNTRTIEVGDFAVFRPDVEGNYSTGRFFEVFDGDAGAAQITAATLVEQSTTFGGINLEAGDVLYTAAGDTNVYKMRTASVGVNTTSGTHSVLLAGGSLQIDGIELVERATRLGDIVLDAGTLLLSTNADGLVGGPGGSVNVTANDIFAFQADAAGNIATLVFEGDEVGLSPTNGDVNAIALNYGPTVLRAFNDSFDVDEGHMISGSASDNDQLFNPSTSTYTVVTSTSNGALTLRTDGTFDYTHDGSETTSDSFSYEVTDQFGNKSVASVNINITPVNDIPVATDDTFDTDEDTQLDASVATNDSDAETSSLTYTVVTQATHGLVSLDTDGSFSYTPTAQFHGTDTFTYQVDDGNSGFATATVTIDVAPINDVPVANDDSISTNEDVPVLGNVATNDSDQDGDSLTYTLITAPIEGTLTFEPNGTFSYDPAADFHGTDSFTYRVSDGNGGHTSATVSITVNPVDDLPVAVNDSFSVDEDGQLNADVSANDSDADAQPLSFSLVATASHGTLEFRNDGTFTYTPDADFFGVDQFEYEASDGTSSASATVTIHVQPINDAPIAEDDLFSVDEDTHLSGSVAGNDIDLDDTSLTFRLLSGTNHGQLSLRRDGTFEYQPNVNFNGVDSFLYEVEDAIGATSTANVSISIHAINDAPNAADDFFAMLENETLTRSVATNDTDVDDTELVYMLTSPPANGAISFGPDGTFSFTPDTEFVGVVTFEYAVSDESGATTFATATIDVANVNKSPVANDDQFAAQEDIKLFGSVGMNDSDPDGDPMMYSLVSGPAAGQLNLNQDGSFAFTLGANRHGTFSFVYRTFDEGGLEDTAEVTIDVAAVNDAPIASDDEFTASVSAPVTIDASDLLANDKDVENDDISVQLLNAPAHGTVSQTPDGTITYVPNTNFVGIDNFSYVVTDGFAASAPANVSITILGAPPVTTTIRTESAITDDGGEGSGDGGETSSNTNSAPTIGALLEQVTGTNTDNDEGTVVGLLNDSLVTDDDTELESFVAEIATSTEAPDTSLQISSFSFSSATESGGLLSNRPTNNPLLIPVELAEIGRLDFSQYLLEGESYVAIMEGMDEFRETLKSNLALPELAVEGFVAATSSFSVGVALWLLRGGYIVASVISALPAWQTFDPIPILAYATKEEGESIESLMEG